MQRYVTKVLTHTHLALSLLSFPFGTYIGEERSQWEEPWIWICSFF